MYMKDFDKLSAKIMLYTRVEIRLQELKDARRELSDCIMAGKSHETVYACKSAIVVALDMYLDAVHDYNSFLTGRLTTDVVRRYCESDVNACSNFIRTLKENGEL